MSKTRNLLVELLVEELPPKSLKKLGNVFAQDIWYSLAQQKLAADDMTLGKNVVSFASPRRLAVWVKDVSSKASDQPLRLKLMPAAVGLDSNGKPTAALLKKLATIGVAADTPIERAVDGKAETLFVSTVQTGVTLSLGLQIALTETLKALPIPKVMSYQLADGWSTVNFVRPAHSLVALHGADVVPVQALGLTSGRNTQGHRFEAQMDPVVLQDADHYAQQLETQGAVIAAFDHRRADIVRQLQHAAAPLGLTPIDDDALLDEVTALVERPNVLLCQFEAEFLAVPSECLILTMKANQKYFPLLDAKGALTNKFLVVSNIRPDDASAIVQGNERVVRPRLADAKFFFDQDRKKTLESRLPMLDKVVYHAKLGSQGERTKRVRAIAKHIAERAFPYEKLADDADRAAMLAKADLLTDMVGEFPELQGVMGGYYARHDRETLAVAEAIEDHYRPRFAGDELPRGKVGLIVALADKLETLVGLFGVGQLPTGDKDPFALRRHALGVIRMLSEREVPIDVDDLVMLAVSCFGAAIIDPSTALLDFIYERMAGSLREQGYSPQEVEAVLSQRPRRLADIGPRLTAVRAFAALPESASLAAANKRIGNILKKSDAAPTAAVNESLLVEPAERALASALRSAGPLADKLFDNGEYTASLRELAVLKAPVDAFFDGVMVNTEDPKLRVNRLALLQSLHAAMNRVADLSKLAT